ncbi:TetR/AcrR family transcriptional regulator [Nocardiopsis sp. EMB25]|uniref:helix-turn-helix domain-containing protein n=1 Tax=Nocardiopsis TaxID=2013 RepID=UPI000345FEF5|nr:MULTISPECIES: helix-turn-helix domain-containing protein [Nocardiopsis]MCY9784356.1 TetR/AcrR family transcriptional regulator [Nocardiopsis sp. EMB25]
MGRGRTRGPGRPSSLDEEAIAEAVLDVGFPDLTFAAVARRLGVGQATLYRHAANRDELVRLGLDLAIRRCEWPGLDGPWRPMLERWAVASWRAWERYPGAVVEVTRGVVPPSIVLLADRVGAALMSHGFTARDAVLAVDLVFDLAADNRRGVEALDASVRGAPATRRRLETDWLRTPEPERTDTDDARRALREEMVRAIRAEPIEWFRGKLRVVLSGIESELAPTSEDAPRRDDAS